MYTQHFGLEKPVFEGGIAQQDDLFLGPRQQRVAANLKIGLTTRDSVVTLTGALGVGKTTIAAQALRLTSTRLAQTWVGNTPLAPDDLLELLLAGFDLAPYEMGRVQRLQTWRQYVGEMSATDTRICILVENALVLGPAGLQALEALTAADPNDCPGANLILMAPAGLQELLEEPSLAPLKQRIRSRQRLDPMTPQEVEQYLRHRITVAGGDYDTIVAPGTAAMAHCFSAGIPRVINNVCETALTVAATRKVKQLSPEIVQRVAEGVYGLVPRAPLPKAPIAGPPEPVAAPGTAAEQPTQQSVPPVQLHEAPIATAPKPVAAPDTAAEQATQQSVPPVQLPETPIATAPEPVAAPDTAAEQPTQPPVPPAKPAPAPATAPVAAAEPSKKPPVPPKGPAPVAAAAPVKPREAEKLEVPAMTSTTDSVEPPPEPPILTDAVVVNADAEPQPAVAVPKPTGAAQAPSALPSLLDEVEFDLPDEGEDVAGNAQPVAATLPPDAPALPEKELQPDDQFTEDFAAATHLHEISDQMAEILFRDYQSATSASTSEAAAPLDSSDLDLSPATTAVMRHLDEDAMPESEENQADPEAAAPSALVF